MLTMGSLTHNQTRFLMSEFARQAHPDAAHRERLSREIPGLSPRQVQVWFQNRSVFRRDEVVQRLTVRFQESQAEKTHDRRQRAYDEIKSTACQLQHDTRVAISFWRPWAKYNREHTDAVAWNV